MKKSRMQFFALLIILFAIIIPIVIFLALSRHGIKLEENIVNYVVSSVPEREAEEEGKLNEIFINNFGQDDQYSVVIKNFKSGEEFKFNENKEYNSASLYKLWVLAVMMQKINEGEIDVEDVMSGDKNKFDETLGLIAPEATVEDASGEFEPAEPVYISMKVFDAIEKMITESDNYAALLLTQNVGYKNVDSFLTNYGFKDSNFGSPPKTTAEDIASFYEKLYLGEIIDETTSAKMLEILKRQTLNDRIPKYLPEDIMVAHKTGELFGAKHDAGIVYSNNGDYMIIVLSQTENESIAAEMIAKFSEDVFKYLNE